MPVKWQAARNLRQSAMGIANAFGTPKDPVAWPKMA